MTVSVVIPTRDRASLLRRTLAGLAAQDLAPDRFEVIVVDDASGDETPRFLETARMPFPLHAVRVEANRGRAAARNRGLERARGELVVFLDDDMEVVPGFLRAHLGLHERERGVAGVGDIRNHPSLLAAPIDRYMSTRGAQKIRARGPLAWKYFATGNSSVRREDLAAIGGFDENFVSYGFEDLEIAWRLARDRRLAFLFVEGAGSLHLHAFSLDEMLERKTIAARSSLAYLFRKHPEARRALGYERFDAPAAGAPLGLNLARALYGTLFTPPVYGAVRAASRLPLGRLSYPLFDYLVQYHYLKGLRCASSTS
jgi:glycosyltransferase involved in cell wall biosynthesis